MRLTHVCSKCSQEKPSSKFQLYKGKPGGQCRECKTAGMKAKRMLDGIPIKRMSSIVDGEKLCLECDTRKLLEEFSPSARGLGGVAAYCRTCMAVKYQDRKKGREATARYRKRHYARHLAMHRKAMHEYRTNKKVADDGTVTDEFLERLYGTSICHYCNKETILSERTADHMTPLSKGGAHSATNLTMACFSCNSSKRDRTESEFFDFLKRKKSDNRSKNNRGLDQPRKADHNNGVVLSQMDSC